MDIVLRTALIVTPITSRRILRSATALDLVVLILFSGVVLPSLLAGDQSLTGSVLGMATVAGMHLALSRLRMRFPVVGMITKGTSVRIYAPTGCDENQMLRSRMTMQDSIAERRAQGRLTLDEVDTIIVEHNGPINILAKPDDATAGEGRG